MVIFSFILPQYSQGIDLFHLPCLNQIYGRPILISLSLLSLIPLGSSLEPFLLDTGSPFFNGQKPLFLLEICAGRLYDKSCGCSLIEVLLCSEFHCCSRISSSTFRD